jgi:hypothetical protein
VQQQQGMPPMQTQHMQPAFMQPLMQSQQACSISQQCLSPDVQVMHTPSLVISHLQLHMAKLHWHMTMPFIIHEQLHMPFASMRQMFCNVPHDTSSSQLQVILIPPVHFSIFILHCGTMAILAIAGAMLGIPGMGIDEPAIPAIDMGRSTIIMDIAYSFRLRAAGQAATKRSIAACAGRQLVRAPLDAPVGLTRRFWCCLPLAGSASPTIYAAQCSKAGFFFASAFPKRL